MNREQKQQNEEKKLKKEEKEVKALLLSDYEESGDDSELE